MTQQMDLLAWQREVLVHHFGDHHLLLQALNHPSAANEMGKPLTSNQRLEFLGDAVLELVMSEHLYRTFPNRPEGELTKMRAALVSEPTLALVATRLAIGVRLRLSRGDVSTGGRERPSTLADAFEAITGAIYLDAGLEAARAFVLRHLGPEVERAGQGVLRQDFKTLLQEQLQQRSTTAPRYEVVAEDGPDHAKRFGVRVVHGEQELGRGWGRSKKEAEQQAAREALRNLGVLVY